jgi:hypothetical protein
MRLKQFFLISINIILLSAIAGYSLGMDKISQQLRQRLSRDSGTTVYPGWIYFSDKSLELEQKLIQAEQSLLPKAAALVWQVNPSFMNMQVLEALRNTAFLYSHPDNQYGWGIINAYATASPVTSFIHKSAAVSEKFTLYGNYPNPFNPVTTISYELLRPAGIQIMIFDALGERVQLVYSGISPAGKQQLIWHASQLGCGMYYFVLMSGKPV